MLFYFKVLIKFILVLIALLFLYCLVLLFYSGYQFFIIIFTVISSYLFTSKLFKKLNIIDKLNIVFLILCCQIILITEILSLFNKIYGVYYLTATIVLFLVSLLLVKNIKQMIISDFKNVNFYRNYIYVQDSKLLTFFLCAILISFAWRMFLIIYVPPNNWDSMTYHLSRVAYWLQNQSLRHYYSRNSAQVIFPFNGEILLLWTMAASKLDRFCGFIQFVCYLLSGTLVYKCAREYLKISVIPALIVMLVWYALPEVILESTSTQNDLVVAYFIMFSLVYFLLGIPKHTKYLVCSAIALGIAMGTKTSALFFALPFAIIILFLLAKGTLHIKSIVLWGTIFVVSFMILSSYNFIQNYLEFHNLLGLKEFIAAHKISNPSLKSFSSNLFQHLFNIMINQTGLHLYIQEFSNYYNIFVAKIGAKFFQLFCIPTNFPGAFSSGNFDFNEWAYKFSLCEDVAFFGTAGTVIILLMLYILLMEIKSWFLKNAKLNHRYSVFAFLFIGFLSTMSFFLKWDPWQSRFMTGAVLMGIPLLSIIFESKLNLIKRLGQIIILYSIILLVPATFMNERKPLTGLFKDKIGLRSLARPEMEPIIRKFNLLVPKNAKIGIVLPKDSYDFPLFGEGLEKTIVPLNLEVIKGEKFDFLAVVDTAVDKEQSLKEFIRNNYRLAERLGRVALSEWVLYVPKKN